MKADFLPIILGSDENAYGTARLFEEAYGVRPLLLCGRQLQAACGSRLFRIEVIPDFNCPEVFVPAMKKILKREAESAEKILVIPCADYYSELLTAHWDSFEGLIANSFPTEALVEELSSKPRFYELCRTYGLPCPKSLVILPEEREAAMSSMPWNFPIVLKPENSNATDYLSLSFPGKKKVYYLRSEEEYRTLADAMDRAGYRGALVVQEYIPGGEDSLLLVNTYSDGNGQVRAMGLGQVLLAEHNPQMRGNAAAVITRYRPEILEQIRNFLEAVHYVGFANFDLKIDPRSGETVIFECNPRLGRSSFFLRAAGFNIVRTFTEDVVYDRREDCVFVETEALWRNVPMCVLRQHMENRTLYREAKALSDAGRGITTRYCPEDMSLKRLFGMLRYDAALARSFRRFPKDTDL